MLGEANATQAPFLYNAGVKPCPWGSCPPPALSLPRKIHAEGTGPSGGGGPGAGERSWARREGEKGSSKARINPVFPPRFLPSPFVLGPPGWKPAVCAAREGRLGAEILRERHF